MVAEGTRAESPPPALMVPEGRGSKTQNGRRRGTVKFGRTLDEFSLSLRSAPDLRSGAPTPAAAVFRLRTSNPPPQIAQTAGLPPAVFSQCDRWGFRSLCFLSAIGKASYRYVFERRPSAQSNALRSAGFLPAVFLQEIDEATGDRATQTDHLYSSRE